MSDDLHTGGIDIPDDAFADIDTGDGSIEAVDTDEFTTYDAAAKRVLFAYRERLDDELRAAWRAGYDYVFVATERFETAPLDRADAGEVSLPGTLVYPSDDPRPHRVELLLEDYRVDRYDLRGVTRQEIRDALDYGTTRGRDEVVVRD